MGDDRRREHRQSHREHRPEEAHVEVGEPRHEEPIRLDGRQRLHVGDRLDHVQDPADRNGDSQHDEEQRKVAAAGAERDQHKPERDRLQDSVQQHGGALRRVGGERGGEPRRTRGTRRWRRRPLGPGRGGSGGAGAGLEGAEGGRLGRGLGPVTQRETQPQRHDAHRLRDHLQRPDLQMDLSDVEDGRQQHHGDEAAPRAEDGVRGGRREDHRDQTGHDPRDLTGLDVVWVVLVRGGHREHHDTHRHGGHEPGERQAAPAHHARWPQPGRHSFEFEQQEPSNELGMRSGVGSPRMVRHEAARRRVTQVA